MLWQNLDLPSGEWQQFVRAHPVSPRVPALVLEVPEFGAFLRLASGVVGIMHCSMWQRRPVAGEQLMVRVTSVDVERRLVSLAPG